MLCYVVVAVAKIVLEFERRLLKHFIDLCIDHKSQTNTHTLCYYMQAVELEREKFEAISSAQMKEITIGQLQAEVSSADYVDILPTVLPSCFMFPSVFQCYLLCG